jgi:hypothetical protein
MSEKRGLLLLGDDLAYLTVLSSELRGLSPSVTISVAPHAVRQAIDAGEAGDPAAAIVCLEGSENVGDILLLMGAHPATTFLFLSKASPPRSAVAHAVHSAGGEIISRQEHPLVIATTLIAMLAQSRGARAS